VIKTRCLTTWLHPIRPRYVRNGTLSVRNGTPSARNCGPHPPELSIAQSELSSVYCGSIVELPEGPVIDDESDANIAGNRCQPSRHRLSAAVGVLPDRYFPLPLAQLRHLALAIEFKRRFR